jgi:hypothetical protein
MFGLFFMYRCPYVSYVFGISSVNVPVSMSCRVFVLEFMLHRLLPSITLIRGYINLILVQFPLYVMVADGQL